MFLLANSTEIPIIIFLLKIFLSYSEKNLNNKIYRGSSTNIMSIVLNLDLLKNRLTFILASIEYLPWYWRLVEMSCPLRPLCQLFALSYRKSRFLSVLQTAQVQFISKRRKKITTKREIFGLRYLYMDRGYWKIWQNSLQPSLISLKLRQSKARWSHTFLWLESLLQARSIKVGLDKEN